MEEGTTAKVVGYVRISAQDQHEHGQADALRRSGVTDLVVEQASGAGARPKLERLVGSLHAGDALVATEVSRLGRNVVDVLLLADGLLKRRIHLRILNLGIDTSTPAGALVLTMMAGLAKYERQLLRERQRRGIDAARARGKHLGRPALLDAEHARLATARLLGGETLAAVAKEWRVSERTLSRLVRKHRGDGPPVTLPGGRGKPKHRGHKATTWEEAYDDRRDLS